MERIGIIGVGGIARAIVQGLSDGVDEPPEIFLSPRGARAAAELSARFANARVCADNQDVANRSDVVLIAVRPEQYSDALDGLQFGPGCVVVNVMAGVGNDAVRRLVGPEVRLVRAMPLQGVRDRECVTVTYPSDPVVDALFDRLGGALAVADEAAFAVFSALSATMSTHLAYLATITDWAVRQGIPRADAGRFVRSIFGGVGRALGDESQSLQQMLADHETPEGINERLRTTWFDTANSDKLNGALDSLLADLETGPAGE